MFRFATQFLRSQQLPGPLINLLLQLRSIDGFLEFADFAASLEIMFGRLFQRPAQPLTLSIMRQAHPGRVERQAVALAA